MQSSGYFISIEKERRRAVLQFFGRPPLFSGGVYYICIKYCYLERHAGYFFTFRPDRPEALPEFRVHRFRDYHDRRDHSRQARSGEGAVVDHRDFIAAGRRIYLLHRFRAQPPQAKIVQPQGTERSRTDRHAEPAANLRDQQRRGAAQTGDQRQPRYHYAAAQQQQGAADGA